MLERANPLQFPLVKGEQGWLDKINDIKSNNFLLDFSNSLPDNLQYKFKTRRQS